MDGKVLNHIFKEPRDVSFSDDVLTKDQENIEQGLNEEEAAMVEERLRSLGYL
jgi:hypothetical protein